MHIVYLCSIQVVFSVIQVSFERFKSSCNQIWVKDATGITLFVNEFKGRPPRSKLDRKCEIGMIRFEKLEVQLRPLKLD